MGSWSEILSEVNKTKDIPGGANNWDQVRRKYLKQLSTLTGRPTVVYATAFLDAGPKSRGDVSIHPGDKEGFLEVTRELPNGPLDVILHSPGGTAEGAETIVHLLRKKFDHIRFIVPIAAKSAATMLALSGDELVGDVASELGPIDPQFRMSRPDRGTFNAPALAIKKQFEMADEAVSQDKSKLPLWIPLISQFGPSLLAECDQALDLSKSLVKEWLRTYMFAGQTDAEARADAIANDLTDWNKYKSHGRAVTLDELEALGAHVIWLGQDSALDEAVWRAWNAISLSLQNTGAIKLFENTTESDHRPKGPNRLHVGTISGNPTDGPELSSQEPIPAFSRTRVRSSVRTAMSPMRGHLNVMPPPTACRVKPSLAGSC